MAKLMAPNIRIDWYPEGHFKDPEKPTMAELNNGGYNLSRAIVTGYTLDFLDPEVQETTTIFDEFTSEIVVKDDYEASLQFFLNPRDAQENILAYEQAENLFYNSKNSVGYLTKRFGYKWDEPFGIMHNVSIFKVQADLPRVIDEQDSPILLEVAFIPKGLAATTFTGVTTYEWEGAPHSSSSVKKFDGEIVSRNYIPNPSFELGVDHMTPGDSDVWHFTTLTYAPRVVSGSRALQVNTIGDATTFNLFGQIFDIDPSNEGKFVALKIFNFQAIGMDGGFQWRIGRRVNNSWVAGPMSPFILAPSPVGNSATLTHQIEPNTTGIRFYIYPRVNSNLDLATTGVQWTSDGWMGVIGDTEADALTQVETYWDGDSIG